MVTVKQVTEKGFDFICGDNITCGERAYFLTGSSTVMYSDYLGIWNLDKYGDFEVKEFMLRNGDDEAPRDGMLWVDFRYQHDHELESRKAIDIDWSKSPAWRPSLKNWEESEQVNVNEIDLAKAMEDQKQYKYERVGIDLSLSELFAIHEDEGLYGHDSDTPLTNVGLVQLYDADAIIFRRIEMTPEEAEIAKVKELACDACELLFGVTLDECREDVKSTVIEMIQAGYRKE